MVIKLPSLVVDVIEMDAAIQQGAWPGARSIGKVGRSYAFEFSPAHVKSLISECYERSGPDWDCDWREKVTFARVAKRLQRQLDKATEGGR